MHILYYITSHGYGHAVRSAAVCNALGKALGKALGGDLLVTVRSDVPKQFFEEELTVRHSVRPGGFDVGCLQRDGVTVLMEETLKAYHGISQQNSRILGDEARWCRDNGVDCVISDITPFAFDVAQEAGVPSAAISNFTWHDIYAPYVERFPAYRPMLDMMAKQYSKATVALALYPALPMSIFKNKVAAPVLGRRGDNRRGEISHRYGIDSGKKLGLIYVGNFGLDDIDWKRLETFDGWEFVGVYPLSGDPANYHVVTKQQFRYQDLSASADAIIGKMGYGVFSEALLNGIPLIYLPREDFAEFPTLDAEARRIGLGTCIDAGSFARVGWEDVLNKAVADYRMVGGDDYDGAMMCAREIIKILS